MKICITTSSIKCTEQMFALLLIKQVCLFVFFFAFFSFSLNLNASDHQTNFRIRRKSFYLLRIKQQAKPICRSVNHTIPLLNYELTVISHTFWKAEFNYAIHTEIWLLSRHPQLRNPLKYYRKHYTHNLKQFRNRWEKRNWNLSGKCNYSHSPEIEKTENRDKFSQEQEAS